jgi:predicted porin
MKKHIIAAAVAAAVAVPAMAQNVTVYGRFDQSFNHVNTKTATESKVTTSGLDGGIGGSRLGFRGTEDLGGGLKAGFVFEFGVDAGENTGVGSTRLGFADISGGFGTLRMGRQVSPGKALADAYNPLGNNTNFTPGDVNGSITSIDNRVSNAITYLTPNFNGLTAQLQYADSVTETTSKTSNILLNGSAGADGSANEVNGGVTGAQWRVTRQGNIQGLGVNYSAGPLSIGAAKHDQTGYLAGVKSTADRSAFAAMYNFGRAIAHLEYSAYKIENSGVVAADRKVTTIGVTVPMGAVTLTGQFFDGDRKAGTGTGIYNTSADATAADYSGYKVRAAYALSKRTGLYAQLGETETKPKNGSQKTTVEGYGIGLYHTF